MDNFKNNNINASILDVCLVRFTQRKFRPYFSSSFIIAHTQIRTCAGVLHVISADSRLNITARTHLLHGAESFLRS